MNGLTAIASNVGARVSQVRSQPHARATQPKERDGLRENVRTAALQLIQAALSTVTETTGRDLDVLA